MQTSVKGLFCDGILRVVYRFIRDGIVDHAGEVLLTRETLLTAMCAFSIYALSPRIGLSSGKLTDLALGFLGYAAIALGFCLGATTIALTFPDRDFLAKLALSERPNKPGDALSGLLLVFSWTAIVHWLTIVFVACLLLFSGHRELPFLQCTSIKWRILASITCSICLYALMQFLITVLTLWQAGTSFAREVRKRAQAEASKVAPEANG